MLRQAPCSGTATHGICAGASNASWLQKAPDRGDIVPFDRSDPRECELRALLGNIADMKTRHYAFLGRADSFRDEMQRALQEIGSGKSLLTIMTVTGDHFTSLQPAMKRYLASIRIR